MKLLNTWLDLTWPKSDLINTWTWNSDFQKYLTFLDLTKIRLDSALEISNWDENYTLLFKILELSGKPVQDFIKITELSDVANVDALDRALKYDINKWAKKSVGASYQLNKKATLYYKISSQALLPSLRSIGQLITSDDGSANDLDAKTLKKFAEFDENAKRYVLTH